MAWEWLDKFKPKEATQRFTSWTVKTVARLGLATKQTLTDVTNTLREKALDSLINPVADIWINTQEDLEKFESILNVPSNELPNSELFRQANWVTDKFGYVVEYDVYDIEGKFVGRRTSRLDSDVVLSVDDILAQAPEWILDVSGLRIADDHNLQVKGALRNDLFINPNDYDYLS